MPICHICIPALSRCLHIFDLFFNCFFTEYWVLKVFYIVWSTLYFSSLNLAALKPGHLMTVMHILLSIISSEIHRAQSSEFTWSRWKCVFGFKFNPDAPLLTTEHMATCPPLPRQALCVAYCALTIILSSYTLKSALLLLNKHSPHKKQACVTAKQLCRWQWHLRSLTSSDFEII